MAKQATTIPKAIRALSWEVCLRVTFARSIFLGAERERRLPTAAVGEGGEEEPAEGCQSDDERRRVSDKANDGEDQDEFDEVEEEADEVFCEEDVAHAGGREEVELDAGAVHAEGVVGEDGDAEDGVGDGDGKDEVAEAAAGADAAGEEEDHEDRRDEAVELVDVAAEVEEFFLQAGGDGGVEAEGAGVGSGGRGCARLWQGRVRRAAGWFGWVSSLRFSPRNSRCMRQA